MRECARPDSVRRLLSGLMIVVTAACTSTMVPEHVRSPPESIQVVAVGRIDAAEPSGQRLARRFRASLIQRLVESEEFAAVLSPLPRTLSPGTIVVTGVIDDADEGSEMARFMVGFGIGGAAVHGRFEIADRAGQTLAVFEQSRTSSEGSGLGAHWNQPYMEDLMEAFAEDTAGAVLRWRRGEELEPSFW